MDVKTEFRISFKIYIMVCSLDIHAEEQYHVRSYAFEGPIHLQFY